MPELTPINISLGIAGLVTLVAYGVFILAPAWNSYGRLWERFAASFLTLFTLATLVGVGIVIGGAIVYTYDLWAAGE